MAERGDIVVTWPLSPRVITVAAPSTEIVQQDLVDTLRKLESELVALDDDPIVDAAGKEDLGGGVLVGISTTLQNAQLAFEARTTPTEMGTATAGGVTVLTDLAAHFVTKGVQRGALIINFTDRSVAEVLSVESQTQLTHVVLKGGMDNDWTVGDTYRIFNIVQCNVTGGNLVAIDDVGDPMSPVFPTAFTQVVKTASSSATLQELTAIEYASFENAVHVSILGVPGTTYPTGTPRQPVNNLDDAVAIAVERGFDTLHFESNWTFFAATYLSGYNVTGKGMTRTIFTFEPGSVLALCAIHDATCEGEMIGATSFQDCSLKGLGTASPLPAGDLEILAEHCLIDGLLHVPVNYTGIMRALDCWSTSESGLPPVLDMNGAKCEVHLRNFSGHCIIRNCTDDEAVVKIYFTSGGVTLEDNVTAGNFVFAGNGILDDQSTSVTSMDSAGLISEPTIAEAVWDESRAAHVIPGTYGATGEWAGGGGGGITKQDVRDAQALALSGGVVPATGSIDAHLVAAAVSLGDIATDLSLVKHIESGGWEIKNNQMIFYGEDGVTPIPDMTFDLFNEAGEPSMVDVVKRVKHV